MINRVVLMKLNDRADNSVIAEMQAYVARIGAELEEARAYHLAPNAAADGDGYNWVLHSAFDDEAAMNAYREAPLHQEFVGFCEPYTEDFLVAYYQAPEA
jgi:quinol monooxygenase YgiN